MDDGGDYNVSASWWCGGGSNDDNYIDKRWFCNTVFKLTSYMSGVFK